MVAYADSSFLVSVYLKDSHTEVAKAYFLRNPAAVALTRFSKSETQHAIRMQAYQKRVSLSEMTQSLIQFEHDEAEGFYRLENVADDALFQKAMQISHRYALEFGVRYLDILHVAAAQLVGAKRFLTFDVDQGKLAKALGLQVKP